MSRCFPFPPPGYEKKDITNDVDLLKKEKHREKKHKKEKKDKEKKDNKDKKKKERSEGNDREKKDKKEKRGDKTKDKEKNDDKDKYKSSITIEDEKKLAEKPVDHAGEILGQNGKFCFSNVEKLTGKVFGNSEDKLSQNNHLVKDTKHFRSLQDLGRRIGDGDRGLVQNFMGTGRKKEEKTVVRLVTKDFGKVPEAKDRNSVRFDEPGSRVMPESNGNTMLPSFPGSVEGKFEGKAYSIEKSIGRKVKGETKTSKKKSDKRGEKHREKKSKRKDQKGEKEKKKEVKSDEKTTEQDQFKSEKNGCMGIYSDNLSGFLKHGDMDSEIQGNLRKRKYFEENGIFIGSGQDPELPDGAVIPHLHPDASINPNKPPYPTSLLSSHSLVQNGKVLDPRLTLSSGGISINLVVDEKKLKVNGMIEGQSVPSSPRKPVPTTSKPKKITPHPDAKYLDEILSVPKMEEWTEFDDQEWLLCDKETPLKKPKVGDFCVKESPQVWEKAALIDSADVYALPYVIPY